MILRSQFDEIKSQFRSANLGREPMLLVCDANVHVGGEGIRNCKDEQDWGGKILLSLIKDEGLTLINNSNLCDGIVTRVDPRNGHESTIDLAICNTFMINKVSGMSIDENGWLKLKKYGKKTTETDHNTIVVNLVIEPANTIDNSKEKSDPKHKHFNVKNKDERRKMQEMIDSNVTFDELFRDLKVDINNEIEIFMDQWMLAMEKSFHVVKPTKSMRKGVDSELKALLDEEKWVRRNILENPERGRRIAAIQNEISMKVAENIEAEMELKVNNILQSDNPHSKVFGVRRSEKKGNNLDFPLKDENGVTQVSKDGIDRIISMHFKKVFAQNEVPDDAIWKEYWLLVDEIFTLMDERTRSCAVAEEPTLEEIELIVKNLKVSKATYGCLTIDLVKLGGRKIVELIHRCILKCIRLNTIPNLFREEKMTLLLKNNGVIDDINDYRGIFLRNIILSIFQKWLYSKNADKVDAHGSEYACGGRKKRSVQDALLIVKLVQDYSKWTKTQIIIEFLDVEKFFDSMNFKKALIEAYNSGINGRAWQCYKTINEEKVCVPHVPSGKCTPIEVRNVFAQGSCDAVVMAWPLMDADNKRPKDLFCNNCCIEGIPLNQLTFVDDLAEFTKCSYDTNERNVSNEIFEKKNRLKYKVPKCKVMKRIEDGIDICLNDEVLEVVENHRYLGTIISRNGERMVEMNDRINQSNSVANEIVLICKETELSRIRLRYVKLLVGSCLDSKVKFGCSLWNILKSMKAIDDVNRIKPKLIKRVMQLPLSTPSVAIQYEFGVNDLSLEILMEKIIHAVQTLNSDDNRISKRLFSRMYEKKVPGFCTEVDEACKVLNVSFEDCLVRKDIRSFMKKKVLEIQTKQILEQMLLSSKMDQALLVGDFKYDGKVMKYLCELDFDDARAVFMARYRMLPCKANFPGRWKGSNCNVCGFEDTDIHVFSCPGYVDLNPIGVSLDLFWNTEALNDMKVLSPAAKVMSEIITRMEEIHNLWSDEAVNVET